MSEGRVLDTSILLDGTEGLFPYQLLHNLVRNSQAIVYT